MAQRLWSLLTQSEARMQARKRDTQNSMKIREEKFVRDAEVTQSTEKTFTPEAAC
jgi:hypothetical protein